MSKKKIFAANWKLNKTPDQSADFIKKLLLKTDHQFLINNELFIFPQNFSLNSVASELKNSKIRFGPQQVHTEFKGAFTGENSLELARAMNATVCLIGHSERRQFFYESNIEINKKIKLCHDSGVLPVLCIGESLEQRHKNETLKICFEQLSDALKNIDLEKRIVIAYEPIWAIGTGLVATAQQISDIHKEIFKKMNELKFKDFQILYGGSVKSDNAKELILIPYVDGFLIGGASLEVDSFFAIASSH